MPVIVLRLQSVILPLACALLPLEACDLVFTCLAFSRPRRPLWGWLSPTYMWHVDFDCPKSCSCTCLQLHWNGMSPHSRNTLGEGNRVTRQFFLACPQRSSCVLLDYSVLVHELFESCMLVGGALCVAHRALFNVEFVHNCKLAARIVLRGLRWNASIMRLTSSEVRDFPGDFTRNRLHAVLSLLSENRMRFRIGGWCPFCILKRHWTAVRNCNSASHNTHWTCSCRHRDIGFSDFVHRPDFS
jgi:hypothetical protein